MKDIRPLASLIANETDLTKYHSAYNKANQRQPTPTYEVTSLIPPICKHTFAPEVDSAGLIEDETEFEALNGIAWSSSTFQDAGHDKDAERVDLVASGQQEN